MKYIGILLILLTVISISIFNQSSVQKTTLEAQAGCIQTTSTSKYTITSAGSYTLCATQPANSYGLAIQADSVTLNCNNITIDGGGRNGEPGILIDAKSNITLQNCAVKGFFTGVTAKNASNITINGGNFSDNSYGSPVSRSPGDQNHPVENLVDQSINTGGGIQFESVTNSRITNVTAANQVAGVVLLNSSGVSITGGNFSNNSGWGIKIRTTTNSTIDGITASNNNRWCSDAWGTHQGCETAGIILFDNSDGNTIKNSTFDSNGNGFYIQGCGRQPSNNNTVVNNRSTGSSGNGYEATFSSKNTFSGNYSSNSNYGFWLGYSDHSVVQGNTVAQANGGAINIANSVCNAVVNNQTNSNEPNNNKIWLDNSATNCTSQARECKDNLLTGNSTELKYVNCANTQFSQLPGQCGMNITTTPNPTTTPPPANCPTSSTNTYQSQSITNVGDNTPAQNHPDKSLAIRGFVATEGIHNLVKIAGHTDTKAPQLSTLLDILPSMPGLYQVYEWDWANNKKGPPITKWPVTLIGLSAKPGDPVKVPDSGYDVGGGNDAMVLYADHNALTLKYTREDSVAQGYAIHVHDFCTDPNLVNLYNQLNSSGRASLPTLQGKQIIGTAKTTEVRVAIRDTGEFMDPRSDKDWWIGISTLPTPGIPTSTPPPGATNTPPAGPPTDTPVPQPTSTPVSKPGSLTVKVHTDSISGPLYTDTNAVANPYTSKKSLLVYITGPTSSGHQFGEQLYVPGINKNSCSSKTGFPYQCNAGSIIWRGSDGVYGTTPGAYSARILQIPPGWEKISGADSASGTLSSGGGLTLDLAIRQVGGTTGTPSPSPTTDPAATITPTLEPTLPDATPTKKPTVYGDTNADGVVDTIDYLYYIRAVTGGTLPNGVNPDVNSDGDVSLIDREVIVNILQRQRLAPPGF